MNSETVKLNHLKMAPRKVRLVAGSLKGLSVNEAEAQLLVSSKKTSKPLLKLLRSAVANLKNNKKTSAEKFFIKEIRVDGGPMLKRWMPRAQGRATPIQKKTSHVTLVLAESEKTKKPRFTIIKKERISKLKFEKMKEKAKHKEYEKGGEGSAKKEVKAVEKPGFVKRIFRRKAV